MITYTFSTVFEATMDWVEVTLAKREAKRNSRRRREMQLGRNTTRTYGGALGSRATS